MQIHTQIQQNSYIVALNGSINAETTITVQEVLLEALQYKPKEVMVDCEALQEVSPKSLKSFISTVRSLQRNKIDFVLISVNEQLHHLFACAGVNTFTNSISSTSLIADNGQCDIYFRKL
ncbi:STAS domain-containing protein [Adhaeribacter sp. BT258]|uniref:STAS domain-containing protein n=1 Tax=Adhaeribacter terrigena TaxID=2793070 RepID=A0ABS1C2X9_9BACT|nr:STAS domain-containing protein [Adhaeribacter terrigena]MBK0403766.1 STAS domain-containing protein [Adhaeribacter terrigena]